MEGCEKNTQHHPVRQAQGAFSDSGNAHGNDRDADLNAGVTRITVVTHVMGMTGAYPMDRVCALSPDKVAVSCDGCPVVYWPIYAGQ
ncbi:hypothetical protein D3W54_12395 [Komagataeibacter medellinensis]|uniref:Uncharacterized protein n=1 Tax=Komagataeibacter medellinensis TaxID=1177712 RepID=A0ABQ6W0B3_9PROT|nr:hypothetical protein D3W54_12395 [Komagataeibacter medellinensis]